MFQTELFVLDVSSKELVRLDTAKDGDYRFEIVGWRRDESEVLFLRLNRRHTELQLMVADAATGDARVILTETGETFVVGAGKTFHETVMTLLEGSDRFIWMSERDGWNHLYLYGPDGTLIRQLTRGEFPVLRVVDVDEETGWVYFTAHGEERLYDTQVYRVGLDGKGFKRLTEERGQHAVEFSPSHEYLLDTHSSLDRPPSTDLRRADGTLVRRIWQANADSLKTLAWRPPEEFIVKAADGKTNLYGILYTPSHFDPTEKYPVVDAIYAGPTECLVSDLSRFTSWPYLQALAEQGFVVFVVDGRGTPERSKAFQDVVYGNYGRNEIPDHVAALRQLAERRPYMDTDRVGIFGGSSGGYFTIRAMLTAPDVYDVGVADSPDVDFMHEDHFAFEPYMGLPQDNSDGYEYGSNVRIAGNLRGKLMLMVGTDDFGAYPGTMAMVAALIRESKPYDLVILPNQPHNYSGASGVYAREANTRYLKEHLLP
jgi:dipeptidyl aminopeptidase/acylaminoacyl peptidase